MYIKIRVFCTKFVNKYYSNYDSLQRTRTLLVFPSMLFSLVFHSFEFSIKILVTHG